MDIFKSLFGYRFSKVADNSDSANEEEFASSVFRSINIQGTFDIKCTVNKDGFKDHGMAFFVQYFSALLKSSKLIFSVQNEDFPDRYKNKKITYYWKVRNYGPEARNANCLRGEIVKGDRTHIETTKYTNMHHYVECYAVYDGVVIARNKVIVPIGDS